MRRAALASLIVALLATLTPAPAQTPDKRFVPGQSFTNPEDCKIAVGASGPCYSNTLENQLVSWWKLNETCGNRAGSYTPTVSGSTQFTTNQYLSVADPFAPPAALTISAWWLRTTSSGTTIRHADAYSVQSESSLRGSYAPIPAIVIASPYPAAEPLEGGEVTALVSGDSEEKIPAAEHDHLRLS